MKPSDVDYQGWLKSVPDTLTGDPLWRMQVYRLALFAVDVGWYDVTALSAERRTRKVAEQLYAALGSIGANVSEGYSRSSGRDRVRFYEYALGSARESRTWYYNARHVLGGDVISHRMRLLTHIIRLLLTIIPQERPRTIREEEAPYNTESTPDNKPSTTLEDLLTTTPTPLP